MKKYLAMLLACAMIFAFAAGCAKQNPANSDEPTATNAPTDVEATPVQNTELVTDGNEPKMLTFVKKEGTQTVISSILCALLGIFLGYLILVCINAENAGKAMATILKNFGYYTSPEKQLYYFGSTLVKSVPLIMCGLSVMFAYKAGLFNIGVGGQYCIGICFSLYAALVWQLPWYACIIVAALMGALWGALSGLFKALFNVNEVITSIMMNWIGMNCANLLVLSVKKMLASDGARSLALDAGNPSAIMPRLGLDKLYVYLNIGIFIAAIIAVIVWFVMSKTTFGYELRACGLNRDGAIYAGINAKRNIVLSVVIAGALAGLGGGLCYLAGGVQYTTEQTILSMGFDGISVALLANSHPIGCIFSAIFISYLKLGGIAMQSQGYATEATDIVTAVIIYLAAFSLLLRIKLSSVFNGKKKEVA